MNKIIHYCWFGRGEMSEEAIRAINSWKKYAPEYAVKRWDENNCNIDECCFTRAAYDAKAWAFVSDYFRLKVIYEYGGIYMDVGSELIKPLEDLEEHVPYSAIERGTNTINPGLIIAAEPHDKMILDLLEKYASLKFIDSDEYRVSHTINEVVTKIFEFQGYRRVDSTQRIGEWTLLDSNYFCPKFGFGGYAIKTETHSIHHYSGSWVSKKRKIQSSVQRAITPYIGARAGEVISRVYSEYRCGGIVQGSRATYNLIVKHLGRAVSND